jgi:capsid protein
MCDLQQRYRTREGQNQVTAASRLRNNFRDVHFLPATGVPGNFCTSGNETDWYGRSLKWHAAKSTYPETKHSSRRDHQGAATGKKFKKTQRLWFRSD